jgi:hypothetical protein
MSMIYILSTDRIVHLHFPKDCYVERRVHAKESVHDDPGYKY